MIKEQIKEIPRKFIFENNSLIGIEIFLLFLIAIITFMIYYKTKEIFELTEHKGIKYFRKGFLFYSITSIAGLILLILKYFEMTFFTGIYNIDFKSLFMIIMYTQIIGSGYLLFSIYYKKLKYEWIIYLVSASIIFSNYFIYSRGLNLFIMSLIILILGSASIIKYIESKKNKNKKVFSQIYFIYIILFLTWIFIFIGTRLSFAFDFQIPREIILFIPTTVFAYIYYIVNKTLSLKVENKNSKKI